jgi:DEK C terminal domain
MTGPTPDAIAHAVDDLLQEADLDHTTTSGIQAQLSDHFAADMGEFRDVIEVRFHERAVSPPENLQACKITTARWW